MLLGDGHRPGLEITGFWVDGGPRGRRKIRRSHGSHVIPFVHCAGKSREAHFTRVSMILTASLGVMM